MGSLAFVRARHGFGLGMLRSQLLEQEGEDSLSPETRLVRFLQAQGIDTSKVSSESLDRGRQFMVSGGRRRALFLHISSRQYHDTIRVPTLLRQKATITGAETTTATTATTSTTASADGAAPASSEATTLRIPPADVPESRLFALIQRHRRMFVSWFEVSEGGSRDRVLHGVVGTVLRGQQHVVPEPWAPKGDGRFEAPRAELRFDVQGVELFWRNDELKPVPDSMTHFPDFEVILGREALQCGLISRSEHRHCVHILGTEFDLVQWDEPNPSDQGV
eukprot:RCo017320